ncbi:MAG: diacylglycerol/lipid kinase family protein [Terriglobia bacterium]
MRTATLIYNPFAGGRPLRRQRHIQLAAAILRDGGLAIRLAETTAPGSATHQAREAAANGDDLVIVCGGDGTINEALNGLAPGNTPLAVLPGGTANILAKEIRLSHHPVRAARQLMSWKPQRVGLGLATECDGAGSESGQGARGRYFVCIAGIGFDAHIIRMLPNNWKLSLGVVAYAIEAVRQVFRYPFPVFSLMTGKEKHHASFVVIQRSRLYAGWLHLARRYGIFQPDLSLSLFPSPSRWRYFLYSTAVLARFLPRDVRMIDSTLVECDPGRPDDIVYYELDGELAGKLPAKFEFVPDALTLMMPPELGPQQRQGRSSGRSVGRTQSPPLH